MVPNTDVLEINPRVEVQVDYVGHGKHKLVIADNFYRFPDRVLELATELPYSDRFALVGNFPGVRAQINLETQHIIRTIGELWGESVRPFFNPQPVVFQAITTKEYRLNIGQRQPHIDRDLTAMVYLNPARTCEGGTGLYRHRLTGLERLPIVPDEEIRQLADRLELSDEFFQTPEGYENFQNSMIFNPLFANQENAYINDGNAFWELLRLIEMRPNRLIIFDGRMFHSQHIQADQYQEGFRVNQILYLSRESSPSGEAAGRR